MLAQDLPNRRVEAWKFSDLRAALNGVKLPVNVPAAGGVIERLAAAQGAAGVLSVATGNSEVLIERLGDGELAASSQELRVAEGAALTRIVIQMATEGVTLSAARVSVAARGVFRQFVLSEGGRLARVETGVTVEGEGAEIELNGVYLAGAGRHADLTSTIRHVVPNGNTRQLIKGAAHKGGRGVFQGRIEVARGAQKTDARQHHHGLLLAEGAEIYAKPELEIYADDVQCAHGNTAGALDEAALFYMRARGIHEITARGMLTEAFLLEAVPDYLPVDVRTEAVTRIQSWLEAAS